jgi:hypothetical protein
MKEVGEKQMNRLSLEFFTDITRMLIVINMFIPVKIKLFYVSVSLYHHAAEEKQYIYIFFSLLSCGCFAPNYTPPILTLLIRKVAEIRPLPVRTNREQLNAFAH